MQRQKQVRDIDILIDKGIEKGLQKAFPEQAWEEYALKFLFGDMAQNRVLQFLIVNKGSEYTLKDIARHTHVGYRTFYRFIHEFVNLEILQVSRKVGAAKLFRLNEESLIVKSLERLALETALKKVKS